MEEVKNIIVHFPMILGYAKDSVKRKIEFYDKLGLRDIIFINSRNLIQSIEVTYARYCFFKDKEVIIDMSNYAKLFMGEVQFKKTYGISKEALLVKYPYNSEKGLNYGRIN